MTQEQENTQKQYWCDCASGREAKNEEKKEASSENETDQQG